MASIHSFDEVTGWSFDTDVQQTAVPGGEAQQLPTSGGLVLRNITHRANNFARSLRLVGIRLDVKEFAPTGPMVGQKNILVTLDPANFTLGPIQGLLPREVAAPAVQGAPGTYLDRLKAAAEEMRRLKSYFKDDEGNYSGFGVRADYVSKESLLGGFTNCDISGLKISQIFLFSKYGNDPPHEPSKSLLAARCHPMTTFSMTPNPAVDRSKPFQRIESIRFDYRLHFAIDSVPAPGTQSAPQPRSNQAGLFQDSDSVSFIQAGLSSVVHWSIHRAVTRQAFDSVEKQLILEAIGPGTNHGMSKFYEPGPELRECWDNLHWWGTRGEGSMISAPGAFHAAHMHWRWGGGAIPKVLSAVPEIKATGRPSKKEGLDASGQLLVDPRIWIQTINVAVSEDDPALDPDQPGVTAAKLCPELWGTNFQGLRSPRDIAAGANIVGWYSSAVHRGIPAAGLVPNAWRPSSSEYDEAAWKFKNKLDGTVMLHGIFFAHEAETGSLETGTTHGEHWPRDEEEIRRAGNWLRYS
jgi:hypothetical protein